MTTANGPWSIEISPKDAPDTVRHEHELIELDVNGTEWQSRLVDTAVDVSGRSDLSYFTVLVRREPRFVAKVSETLATISGSSADVPAVQDPNSVSGQKSPMGRREWPDRSVLRRFESALGRRIRTADSALLTELVAVHKAGLVVVDRLAVRVSVAQKVGWLSSLGMGEFTRAQWDHMSKKDRRSTVLCDADMDAVRAFADELNRGDGYV